MTIHRSTRGRSPGRLADLQNRFAVNHRRHKHSLIFDVVRYIGISAAFFAIGCQTNKPRETLSTGPDATIPEAVPGAGLADERVATLHVRGMSCPLCANNIDRQLLKIPGVERVAVNLGNGEVRVRLADSPRPTKEQLVQAIERSGFTLAGIDMPNKGGE